MSPTLASIARAAEDAGFSSLWAMDHFLQIEMIGKPEEVMLEAYSTLNFSAAITKQIRLGTLVSSVQIVRRSGSEARAGAQTADGRLETKLRMLLCSTDSFKIES